MHQDSDTLTSKYIMFEITGCFINPGLQALSARHSIAHVSQIIALLIFSRNPGSAIPSILISSKYLRYIASAIWGARNLKVTSYIPFISPHVKSSLLLGSDIISTGWAHKPVPFEQVINPLRKSCRIILWQIVQLEICFLISYMNCPLTLQCFERSFHLEYPTLSRHDYPSKHTCFTLSSTGSILPVSKISSRALPQSMYTWNGKVTAFGSGSSKWVHLSIRVIARSNIARVRHARTLVHTHGPLRSAQTQRRGYATVPHHS